MVVERVNKFPVVLTFLGIYFALFTVLALVQPTGVAEMFRAPFLHAAVFLASFMLTDPPTAPGRYGEQVWVGALAAVVSVAAQVLGVGQGYLLVGLLAGNAAMFARSWIADRRRRVTVAAPRPALRATAAGGATTALVRR